MDNQQQQEVCDQQPTMRELRWGIAGCGRISGDFVRAMAFYCQTPNKVQAVASETSLDRSREFCAKNSLTNCRCYGSHADMFADSTVDVVYIANLNHQHLGSVSAALEAGKHVLCEKPLGVNEREVREMAQLAKRKGLFLMEAYWTRCFPLWRELLDNQLGRIGPVQMVQCDFGVPVNRVNSMDGIQNGGEGYLMATGCYCLMAVQLVLGGQRPTEVLASGGRKGQQGSDLWANILLRYADDKQLAQVFYSGQHRTPGSLTIYGQRGNIRIPEFFWSPVEATVQQYPEQGPAGVRKAGLVVSEKISCPLPAFDPNLFYYPHTVGLAYEVDHVAQCIREGRQESNLMPLEESATLAWIMDKVRRQLGCRFPQDQEWEE